MLTALAVPGASLLFESPTGQRGLHIRVVGRRKERDAGLLAQCRNDFRGQVPSAVRRIYRYVPEFLCAFGEHV